MLGGREEIELPPEYYANWLDPARFIPNAVAASEDVLPPLYIRTGGSPTAVFVRIRDASGREVEREFQDDGLNGDRVAGDGIYTVAGAPFIPACCATATSTASARLSWCSIAGEFSRSQLSVVSSTGSCQFPSQSKQAFRVATTCSGSWTWGFSFPIALPASIWCAPAAAFTSTSVTITISSSCALPCHSPSAFTGQLQGQE